MSFLSLDFIVFLIVLAAAYFLLPRKWQWKVLLTANMIFYLWAGWKYAGYLALTGLSTYGTAIWIERVNERYKVSRAQCQTKEEKQANKLACSRVKKRIMILVMLLNFGIWIILKYSGFLAGNIGRLLQRFSDSIDWKTPEYVLPLGISFYTFIAIGYCIDVYRGKYKAERHLGKYFLFISFFPQMIQGPFSRYNKLKETIAEEHSFSLERFAEGVARILWGFVKKLVIAGRIGIVTEAIYAEPEKFGGVYVFLLMIFLTLELYADFSGYMDIVCGVCHVLGIRLEENFRQPFFSKSIDELWRRWHITLGAWFRDYLFYSISMSKKVQLLGKKVKEKVGAATARMIPSYIALFGVWTATGLWHGAAWYFLIWGWMNLVIIVFSMQMAPVYEKVRSWLHINPEKKSWQFFQRTRTFLIFGFMEMVSSSESTRMALNMTGSLIREWKWNTFLCPVQLFPGLKIYDIWIVLIGIAVIFILDSVKEKGIELAAVRRKIPAVGRYILYIGMLYLIIVLGMTGETGGFMYAQF